MKCVQIRSFFWSVFPRIRSEYGEIIFYFRFWKYRSRRRRLPTKKVFYKRNSQNSHTSARVFFNKFAGLRPATLFNKSIWHRFFPVNFLKFFKKIFYTEHLRTTFSKSNRFLGDRQIWACFVSWDASASITDVE